MEKKDIKSINNENNYVKKIVFFFVSYHWFQASIFLIIYLSIYFPTIEFNIFSTFAFIYFILYILFSIIGYFYSIYAIVKTKHSKKINVLSIVFTSISVLEISVLFINVVRWIAYATGRYY